MTLAPTSPFQRFAPGSPEHAEWCAHLSAAATRNLVPCESCGRRAKADMCSHCRHEFNRAVRRVLKGARVRRRRAA